MYKISILWGEDLLEDDDEPQTYSFDTEAEVDAFKLAIHVMNGMFGCPHKIVSEGEE